MKERVYIDEYFKSPETVHDPPETNHDPPETVHDLPEKG